MANWAALFSPTTASATSTQPATTPIQQNRFIVFLQVWHLGSGCCTADCKDASDTKWPGFESSHRQILLNDDFLFVEKTKKKKEAENGPFYKNTSKT